MLVSHPRYPARRMLRRSADTRSSTSVRDNQHSVRYEKFQELNQQVDGYHTHGRWDEAREAVDDQENVLARHDWRKLPTVRSLCARVVLDERAHVREETGDNVHDEAVRVYVDTLSRRYQEAEGESHDPSEE